jgi:hypothetical protein
MLRLLEQLRLHLLHIHLPIPPRPIRRCLRKHRLRLALRRFLQLLADPKIIHRVEDDDPHDMVRRIARTRRDRREEVPPCGRVRGHADLGEPFVSPLLQRSEHVGEGVDRNAVLFCGGLPELFGDRAGYSSEDMVGVVVALQ